MGGSWIVEDSSGKPIVPNYPDGSYSMTGPVTSTASENYPGLFAYALSQNNGDYVHAYSPNEFDYFQLGSPYDNATYQSNGADSYADAGNASYANGGLMGFVDGTAVNGSVSMSSTGTLTETWVWVPDAAPNGRPAPPYLDLLISAPVGVFVAPLYSDSLLTSGLTGTATAANGLGDAVTVTVAERVTTEWADNVSQGLAGKHVKRFAVGPGGRVTVSVSLSSSTSAANSVSYLWGSSAVFTDAYASAKAQQEYRTAILTVLGHVPTQHKEISFDPTTQTFVAIGVPNVETGDTLQVDTGLPIAVISGPAESPRVTYPIDYQGGISLFPVLGDSYTITASLNGGNDGGTEPLGQILGFGGRYAIDPFRVNYTAPLITYPALLFPTSDGANYDYSKPQLSLGDTGKIDGIDFNYTFISDGAIAHKRLSVHLHMPTEWSQVGNPLGDENTDQPYTDVESTPSSADGGQPLNVERKPVNNTIAFAYTGASASFTSLAAFAGEIPPLAAFLAVTGYAIDKAAPDNISPTVSDNSSDFADAIKITRQGSGVGPNQLFDNPAWLDTWDNNDELTNDLRQAQCTWKLYQKVAIITFHWIGDNYGAFGYTGQVKTDVTQAEQPAYFHFYTTPPVRKATPPNQN